MNEIILTPIGTIRTPFRDKQHCPIQPTAAADARGRVEVLPRFAAGLETIETFTHLMLFYYLDRAAEVILSRPTFLDDNNHGVFASRHPCRPNGIGFSIVELVQWEGNLLHVRGVDMLDNSPLLDIKPYVPRFDARPGAGNGWVEGKTMGEKPPGRE